MSIPYAPPQARDFALAFELAERERRRGHLEAALGVYRIALSQWPAYPPGWLGLSHTLFALRRWPEAWEAFGARFEALQGGARLARATWPDLRAAPRMSLGARPRHLAVIGEGGPGDIILFSQFLAPMMATGVALRLIARARCCPCCARWTPRPCCAATTSRMRAPAATPSRR